MKLTPSEIFTQLKCIAPILSISFSFNDKSSWIVKFEDAATDEQKLAAQSFIDAIELPLILQQPSTSAKMFISLFTKAEKKLISKSNYEDVNDVWLTVTSSAVIEPYGTEVAGGLAVLVSAGILTQARSNEILTQAKQLADNGCCDNKYTP